MKNRLDEIKDRIKKAKKDKMSIKNHQVYLPDGDVSYLMKFVEQLQGIQSINAKEKFSHGIRYAAEIADTYNGTTTHPYRLGDCILFKLNQTKKKPRKNKKRLSLNMVRKQNKV